MYKPTTFKFVAKSYREKEKFEAINQLLLIANCKFTKAKEIITGTKNNLDGIKKSDS